MKTPHKHAALIHAWADGAEIEVERILYGWVNAPSPQWLEQAVYRIKPEPKPDIVEWHNVVRSGCTPTDKPNIKLTFDSVTGVLKDVEILI